MHFGTLNFGARCFLAALPGVAARRVDMGGAGVAGVLRCGVLRGE